MAYRRKHNMTRSTTFEDHRPFSDELPPSPTVSLAAQAIRASAAHRDSSLSSAYGGQVAFSASSRDHLRTDHPKEGLTIVENRTNDIIQETKKLQNRRKTESPDPSYQTMDALAPTNVSLIQAEYESQLKASRDVANAMAAKAKLLLRELKTLKADLAFVKERSTQLEEENKILQENRQKGNNSADDDMIRLQLETLLAEKARLAHENFIYARENRFLREVVEYHQLTMHDVVYLDEGNEEIAKVGPIHQFSAFSSPARSKLDVLSPVIPCSRSTTPNRWLSQSPSALILSASPTSHYSPPRNKALSVAFGTGLSPPSPKAKAPIQRCSSTPSS